jgi:hypothetical protein
MTVAFCLKYLETTFFKTDEVYVCMSVCVYCSTFFLEHCIAQLDDRIEEPTVGWALKILWCKLSI